VENHLNQEQLMSQNTTDINDVKQKNASSGLTYNEVKQMLAQKIRNPDENLMDKTQSFIKNNR
jgi:hypothetical protein